MIKLKKETDAIYLYLTKESFIHTVNDWKQIFGKWNWYEFRIIEIYIENDAHFAEGIEFSFVILGLGFRFRYNKKAFQEKCKEIEKDIEDPSKLKCLDELEEPVAK